MMGRGKGDEGKLDMAGKVKEGLERDMAGTGEEGGALGGSDRKVKVKAWKVTGKEVMEREMEDMVEEEGDLDLERLDLAGLHMLYITRLMVTVV